MAQKKFRKPFFSQNKRKNNLILLNILRRNELENLYNFSLKIRPVLNIVQAFWLLIGSSWDVKHYVKYNYFLIKCEV